MNFNLFKKIIFVMVIGGILFSVPHAASAQEFVVETFISGTLLFINNLAGQLLAGTADIFGKVLRLQVYQDLPAIVESWRVIRDFANIFFIIGIIVMAFSIILDLNFMGGQDWRTMLGRFIFIALIINFSLAISGAIINGTQIVSNVFLNSIGDASTVIGQYTPITKITVGAEQRSYARVLACTLGSVAAGRAGCELGSAAAGAVAGAVDAAELTQSATMQLFVNTLLQIFMIFSLGIGIIYTFVRIPVLWFLMVIAPLAWVCGIFPSLRKYHQQWWDTFLSWNFFLPTYLMFLYFGFFFLSRQNQIMQRIQETTGLDPNSFQGAFGLTFQEIMVYVMAYMFLIYGARMAFETSKAGGSSATAAAVKGKGMAVGRWLSYRGGYREAAEQRWKQFKKEGFQDERIRRSPIGWFGGTGQEGYQKRVAGAGMRLGVRDAEKNFYGSDVESIKRNYNAIKDKFDKGLINKDELLQGVAKFDSHDSRSLAYRRLIIEKGLIPADAKDASGKNIRNTFLEETLDVFGDNPYAIDDISDLAEKAKFANMPATRLLEMARAGKVTEKDPTTGEEKVVADYSKYQARNFTPFRQKAYLRVAGDPRALSGMKVEDFASGLSIMGGNQTAEGRKFIEDVGKSRPDLVIEHTYNDPGMLEKSKIKRDDLGGKLFTPGKRRMFEGFLKDADDIAKMSSKIWEMPEFQSALRKRLSQGSNSARIRFMNNLENQLRFAVEGKKKQKILEMITVKTDIGGVITRLHNNWKITPETIARMSIEDWKNPDFQQSLKDKIIRLKNRDQSVAIKLVDDIANATTENVKNSPGAQAAEDGAEKIGILRSVSKDL